MARQSTILVLDTHGPEKGFQTMKRRRFVALSAAILILVDVVAMCINDVRSQYDDCVDACES